MPIVVERSLFKTGEDSLAVTLPKAWARYLQLKAGDRVIIVANDELVIRLKQQEEQAAPSRRTSTLTEPK